MIIAVADSLFGPLSNWLTAVTITVMVSLITPLGSFGAVNVSVVIEPLTGLVTPL